MKNKSYWLRWSVKLGLLSIPVYLFGFILAFYTFFVRVPVVEWYFKIVMWPAKFFKGLNPHGYYPGVQQMPDAKLIVAIALGWAVIGGVAGFAYQKIVTKYANN